MNQDERSWVVIGVLVGLGIIFGSGWAVVHFLPRLAGFLGSGL